MSNITVTLEQWVTYLFDHPVTDPAWHWSLDAPYIEPGNLRTATLIADTFERAAELLSPYSGAQLNQGFWFLLSNAWSEYMYSLIDQTVPWNIRRRALRSIIPLFEQVMAIRCSSHLSHLDERPADPLNSACYMWWDINPIHGKPKDSERAEFDAETLSVLRRLLSIPHDACRESALHGLGHWQIYYPQAAEIIDEFLIQFPGLRLELIEYAHQAREGCIQ
jgi:uncharacterized protein (UPF0147 family)